MVLMAWDGVMRRPRFPSARTADIFSAAFRWGIHELHRHQRAGNSQAKQAIFGGKPNKLMLDGTYVLVRLGGVRALCGLSGSLVGTRRDFRAAAVQQCPAHAASRHSSVRKRQRPAGQCCDGWGHGSSNSFWQISTVRRSDAQRLLRCGAHLTMNPLQGLEVGVAKTEQFCGRGPSLCADQGLFHQSCFSTNPNNVER